ncbi:MAG: translation elongation factor Ts [Anaerolineae bacterium]|nr:translation elongation factor Ts [Anaerolineae bacterium]MCO5189033.1 translation elongation factor Ts [Anaerolineae bacterium]
MNITVEMVKELREATGAGVLDAKKALEAANGDFDEATVILREKGLARVAKKSGRSANEGLIEMYAHPGNRVGVILEINCETDFVARNEEFVELAHDIALQIAAMSPRYVGKDDVPEADLESERELLTKQALAEGKPEQIVAKIVDGRMRKFYEEYCLLEQPFVKDDSMLIQDMVNTAISKLGENIVVRRFERYELGESL